MEQLIELEFGNNGSNQELKSPKVSLKLKVNMSVGIGGDRWPAAIQFCNLLSNEWTEEMSKVFQDSSVLELGSGTGLVGLVVEKLFKPKCVNVTDQLSHVQLIQENLDINESRLCRAEELDWFSFDKQNCPKYDVILALECIYKKELYMPLIDCLEYYSHSKSVIILGCSKDFTSPLFFQLLEKKFTYCLIPPETYKHSDENIALFICQKAK